MGERLRQSGGAPILKNHKIDCVIQFAGLKAVGESVQKPLEYYRNNLDSTLTLCEVMRAHNVKRFVFSSSATVYGVPDECRCGRTCSARAARTPMAGRRYMIEKILQGVVTG